MRRVTVRLDGIERGAPWGHRWGHATRIGDIPGSPVPHDHAERSSQCGVVWARLDSNQGATDYESAALTTELRAREASVTQTFDGSGRRFTVKRRGEPPVG